MINILEYLKSDSVIIMFIVSYICLIILVGITFIKMNKLNKEYKVFMSRLGKDENISDILKLYLNKVDIINKENKEIKAYCEKINDNMNLCIQKIGLVRYNAFKDVGSDLSFALAILDNNDNGIVLNGIYAMESSNIYAKPIKNGTSSYKLSDEETRAIDIAIQKKNFIDKYK